MRVLNEKLVLTLAVLAVNGLLLANTLGLSRVAQLVPLSVLVPTMALILFQLVLDVSPRLARKYSALESKDVFGIEQARTTTVKGDSGPRLKQSELSVIGWLVVMVCLILALGSLTALPLFSLLYLKLRSKERWQLSVAVAAAMFAVLYGVFVLLLNTRVHQGWLWSRFGI